MILNKCIADRTRPHFYKCTYLDRIEWCYYKPGKGHFIHNEDGPAIESQSGQEWWVKYDNIHRIDGPATTFKSGAKSYYLYNIRTLPGYKETLLLIHYMKALYGLDSFQR
jgi:hypothetical protein